MKKNLIFTVIFALAFGFSGCDTGENVDNIEKKGTMYVHTGVVDSLEIAHNSKGFTFPDTFIDESAEVTIVIKNIGNGDIKLTGSPYVNLDGATAVFLISSPLETSTVSPGSSASFKIKYAPMNATESYVYVSIPNNSENAPDFSFTVYGTGVRPKPTASIFYGDNQIPQNGTINIGEVLLTQSKIIPVVIKNTGREVLTVDTENITISGADVAVFTQTTNPGSSVSVGEQTSFFISCEPFKQGENNAILTIPTNDSSRNPVVIYLQMTAVKGSAILELRQDATVISNNSLTPFDFGRVALNSNKPLVFTIKNTGNIALELTGNPAVESSNAIFAVSIQPINKIISPGDDISFILRYTPVDEKEDNAAITIFNTTNDMVFTLYVKGTGYIKRPQITVKHDSTTISPNGEFLWGNVLINSTRDITFTIENSGEEALHFITENDNRINLENNVADYFSVILQPFATTVVSPGSTTTFIIRFKPTTLGNNITASVHIKTDSQYYDIFSFWIKGNISNIYQIGDIGPGGGFIFFAEGGQYKECSGELGSYPWDQAVTIASSHRGGGFTNWRLPDRGELSLMYQNLRRKNQGGFYSDYYWSSAQYSSVSAWYTNFSSGSESYQSKSYSYRVRAVRSFSL